jgi:hypothetical protein
MNSARPQPHRDAEVAHATAADIARAALEAAQTLERGQAEQPLVGLARTIDARESAPWTVALLASTPQVRETVLGWLAGGHYPHVSAQLTGVRDAVVLQLRRRGFAIADDAGRREFTTAEDFAEALAQAAPEAPRAGRLTLAMEAAADADIDLFVLPDPSGHPATALPSPPGPSLLLVAAGAGDDPGPEMRKAFAQLAVYCTAAWPVIVTAPGTDPARAARTWSPPGLPALPLTTLESTDPETPLPAWLVSPSAGQDLAGTLRVLMQARRAGSVVDMIQERHENDLAQLRSRLRREQRLERSTDTPAADAAARAELDAAKQRTAEDFAGLLQSLRESQRRALLHTGVFGSLCLELSQRVQSSDLVQEDVGRNVRLTLDRTFAEDMRRRFSRGVRSMLDEQATVIRDTFDIARRRCEAALHAAGSRTLGLPLEPPDPAALWESLRDVIHLEMRYAGEIPRRGFLQRLTAGRQLAFGVLMVLSLVGSFVGLNIRRLAIVGVAMLLLFLLAVGWTFVSWKKADAKALELEMQKVRTGVRTELDRLASEVSRDLQTRLLETVEQARRDFMARYDAAVREWASECAARVEDEKRDVRQRIKVLEQRERDLSALGQQVSKLRLQLSQLTLESTGGLRKALQAPPAGAPL